MITRRGSSDQRREFRNMAWWRTSSSLLLSGPKRPLSLWIIDAKLQTYLLCFGCQRLCTLERVCGRAGFTCVGHETTGTIAKVDAVVIAPSTFDIVLFCCVGVLGSVRPSFRALSGSLQFTARSPKFDKDSLSVRTSLPRRT